MRSYKKELGKRNDLIKIPPNWKEVVISPDLESKVQVTGTDKKGKKQYIYHPLWEHVVYIQKRNRMARFIRCIPKIVKKAEGEVGIIVEILLLTGIRIGNDKYLRENNSRGLLTLEKKHVRLYPPCDVGFEFLGKRGIKNSVRLTSSEVFNYVSSVSRNRIFSLTSSELNKILEQWFPKDTFTCKDFRTYFANRVFLTQVLDGKSVGEAYKTVSEKLGNTVSVTKKNYIFRELEEVKDKKKKCKGFKQENDIMVNLFSKNQT